MAAEFISKFISKLYSHSWRVKCIPTDSRDMNCIALAQQGLVSCSFSVPGLAGHFLPWNFPMEAQLMPAMDIFSFKRQAPVLKGAGLTLPALCLEPTHTPRPWLSWPAEAGSGCDCVELDSSRLLMGGSPLKTSLRLYPSHFAVIKCRKQGSSWSRLLNLDCIKPLFKNVGFLVHIIFWISWHPWGRKALSHGRVLQPPSSPPAEAGREDHYYQITPKLGFKLRTV